MSDQQPTIGRIVHYVSYGTPGGEYTSQCRAAIITGVPAGALLPADDHHAVEHNSDNVVVDLAVINPSGLFFNRCAQLEPDSPADLPHLGGAWHWPERTPPTT